MLKQNPDAVVSEAQQDQTVKTELDRDEWLRLNAEVYALEVNDRQILYGDSFMDEWNRMSNCSPDDFD